MPLVSWRLGDLAVIETAAYFLFQVWMSDAIVTRENAVAIFFETMLSVVATAALAAIVLWRRKANLRMLGWRLPTRNWMAGALGLGLFVVAASGLAGTVVARIFPQAPDIKACLGYVPLIQTAPLLMVGYSVLIAPVLEETLFRGLLFGWLRTELPVVPAAVLSGVVFGLFHLGGTSLPFTFPLMVVGCILALIYHYSGSLFVSGATHAVYNIVALIPLLLHPSCAT